MALKILHIYKTFLPDTQGGVEQYILHLAAALRKYDCQLRLVCISKACHQPTTYQIENVVVHAYPETFNLASCPVSLSFLYHIKSEIAWADVVHYHYPWPFVYLIPLLFWNKKPKILTYHSDIIKQKFLKIFLRPLEVFFLRQIDLIIATSPQYLLSSGNLQSLAYKVKVLPICLDSSLYPKPQKVECLKIQRKFGKNFFLFVGQLRYYKGLHLLLEAMQGIEAKLVIAGSGGEEKKFHALAKRLKLNNVYFIGNVDEQEKINYLASCYSLILPSHLRSEAFGIVLLEASMLAKPLISCSIGTGTEYVNQHEYSGLVVKPHSQDLRLAMQTLLASPDLAERMGKNALKHFQRNFSSDKVGKEMIGLLEMVAK